MTNPPIRALALCQSSDKHSKHHFHDLFTIMIWALSTYFIPNVCILLSQWHATTVPLLAKPFCSTIIPCPPKDYYYYLQQQCSWFTKSNAGDFYILCTTKSAPKGPENNNNTMNLTQIRKQGEKRWMRDWRKLYWSLNSVNDNKKLEKSFFPPGKQYYEYFNNWYLHFIFQFIHLWISRLKIYQKL